MRSLLFASLLSLYHFIATAQTIISTNTTWSGTVLVEQNTVVDQNSALTIEPGTVVRFAEGVNLTVLSGSIVADGTPTDSIYFSGAGAAQWGGLDLQVGCQKGLFRYCNFSHAKQDNGGALRSQSQGDIMISHSTFIFNEGVHGGAICFDGYGYQIGTVEYCVIARNEAEEGGGVYVADHTSIKDFRFNTIVYNSATETGGFLAHGDVNFINNISWGNEGGDFNINTTQAISFPLSVRYSLIGETRYQTGMELIDADPMFNDAANNDFTLSDNSPAIDRGCHCMLDSDGTRSDIGSLSFQQSAPHLDYIILDSLNTRNVTLQEREIPYMVCTDLKLRAGETLNVDPGVTLNFVDFGYIEVAGTLNLNGAVADSVIFTAPYSNSFPGFDGNVPAGWGGVYVTEGGKLTTNYAVIERLGARFTGFMSNGNGAISLKSSTASFRNTKFILKDDLKLSGNSPSIRGESCSLEIKKCLFRKNMGKGPLVDINSVNSSNTHVTIDSTVFERNEVSALVSSGGNVEVRNSRFENNVTRTLLGVSTYAQLSTIENNVFKNNKGTCSIMNTRTDDGYSFFRNNVYENNKGALDFYLGRHVMSGNVYRNNQFDPDMYLYGSTTVVLTTFESHVRFVNNTISDNRGSMSFGKNPYVVNNIFFNNSSTGGELYDTDALNEDGNVYRNNITQLDIPGGDNIAGNPRLANDGPALLQSNSPAIDKGDYGLAVDFVMSKDVFGYDRINRAIDIGANEYPGDYIPMTDLIISDTVVLPQDVDLPVATLSTGVSNDPANTTYSFVNENGLNNDYFKIENDKLILVRDIRFDALLRIKLRAERMTGAWLEEYFYLYGPGLITSVEDNSEFTIYPIPAADKLYVAGVPDGTAYSITDVRGTKVTLGNINNGTIEIDTLSNGVYVLQVILHDKIYMKKFITIGE